MCHKFVWLIERIVLQIDYTDVWGDNLQGTTLEFSQKTTPTTTDSAASIPSLPSVDINAWQIDNITHKHKISVIQTAQVGDRWRNRSTTYL